MAFILNIGKKIYYVNLTYKSILFLSTRFSEQDDSFFQQNRLKH